MNLMILGEVQNNTHNTGGVFEGNALAKKYSGCLERCSSNGAPDLGDLDLGIDFLLPTQPSSHY